MNLFAGKIIKIEGIVQGVGFRPFVYGLATRLHLTGWVRNTSAGVEIEINGSKNTLEKFIVLLQSELPPLARIDNLEVESSLPGSFPDFSIFPSKSFKNAFQPVSPDVCICPECLQELLDPTDRRYLYPFINCTNCGPRFTIIKDLPYDRPDTTMAEFEMCNACSNEYNNPLDRRFHAQPVACPECGPHIWIEHISNSPHDFEISEVDSISTSNNEISINAVRKTQELIMEGKIIAIKGLGGFHLACDAYNADAVRQLRERKLRVDKPFAVMMKDITIVTSNCSVNKNESELIESRESPIVVIQKLPSSKVAAEVSPNQNTIGVMLPYTPLHYLLFTNLRSSQLSEKFPDALVMTSGNLSEEPIATENKYAIERLAGIADAFLLHNRRIHSRCDDSVYRIFVPSNIEEKSAVSVLNSGIYPLRRSRGFAPNPFVLPFRSRPVLAVGADLKNTFSLIRDKYSVTSHHIGDLENFDTLKSFEDSITHYEGLFRTQPETIAHDLHPDYFSTRYAFKRSEKENIPLIGVQHHHAHIASCMAENNIGNNEKVIGIAFDGTGYGTDGAVWGGEILLSDYQSFQRLAQLNYVPLPGGDLAIKEPWRIALSWLYNSNIKWSHEFPPVLYAHSKSTSEIKKLDVLLHQIQTGINSPLTSSMGRLFDALSALIGIREIVNYEAQAAIELEAIIDPDEEGTYPIDFIETNKNFDNHGFSSLIIDPSVLFHTVVSDLKENVPASTISAKFHNSISALVLNSCQRIRNALGCNTVALSGGVWQNTHLLSKTHSLLIAEGFDVLIHRNVPSNDGGVSFGQAVIAAQKSAIE